MSKLQCSPQELLDSMELQHGGQHQTVGSEPRHPGARDVDGRSRHSRSLMTQSDHLVQHRYLYSYYCLVASTVSYVHDICTLYVLVCFYVSTLKNIYLCII